MPVHAVEAEISYIEPGVRAVFYPTDRSKSHMPMEKHRVRIESMRPQTDELSLDRNGFALLRSPSAVKDFYDPAEIKEVYYPEIQALVKQITGAAKVLTFGEVARSDGNRTGDGRLPSYGAHVDYQDRTVRQFAEEMLGKDEAAEWLKRRYFLINLWRPITRVERTPLALCDAASVKQGDLAESEIVGGLNDPNRPSMFGFNLTYNPEHRWYYAPRMEPEEILAFRLFDSDASKLQWTGHTAFDDPSAAPDAPPRESIEIRTISFM